MLFPAVKFIQLIVHASRVLSLTTSDAVKRYIKAFSSNKLAIVVMNDVADCDRYRYTDIFRHSDEGIHPK